MKPWKKISGTVLARNDFWEYHLDNYTIGDMITGEYHFVHTPGSTMIIPYTGDSTFLMIRQYRYLNKKLSLEFPCGGVKPGLSRLENAIKELREESGFTAGEISYAAEFSPFTGAADEMCTVFFARGLSPAPLPPDVTEEFEVVYLSAAEIDAAVSSNEIWDGLSLAAWALVRHSVYELIQKNNHSGN
ncbi:MAG: NUDIX hydrolase [Ignavibacteria bacterium]|nr:NUDIX hydrolase [Ignavibacteria bacterium]